MIFVLAASCQFLYGEASCFRVATAIKAFILVVAEERFVLVEAAMANSGPSKARAASLTVKSKGC